MPKQLKRIIYLFCIKKQRHFFLLLSIQRNQYCQQVYLLEAESINDASWDDECRIVHGEKRSTKSRERHV